MTAEHKADLTSSLLEDTMKQLVEGQIDTNTYSNSMIGGVRTGDGPLPENYLLEGNSMNVANRTREAKFAENLKRYVSMFFYYEIHLNLCTEWKPKIGHGMRPQRSTTLMPPICNPRLPISMLPPPVLVIFPSLHDHILRRRNQGGNYVPRIFEIGNLKARARRKQSSPRTTSRGGNVLKTYRRSKKKAELMREISREGWQVFRSR